MAKPIIQISGMPAPGCDIAFDAAIEIESILRDLLEANGLQDEVEVYRPIGLRKWADVMQQAIDRESNLHLLVSIQQGTKFAANPINLDTTVFTLQHRNARLFQPVMSKLVANDINPRFVTIQPGNSTTFMCLFCRGFDQGVDTTTL